jgi:ribosome biogenesis GTPase
VELFPLPEGGWIADSPGFNAGEGIPPVSPQQLIHCFPEVRERLGTCQFRDCLHDREPGCGLRELDWERRAFYLQLLHELQEAQAASFKPSGERHHFPCRKQSRQILTNPELDWQED